MLLATATGLSIAAATNDRLPGDVWLTRQIQSAGVPGVTLSDAVRAITGTEVVLVAGAAFAVALFVLGWRRPAIAFAAGLILLPFLQGGLKDLVDRPRPDPSLVAVHAGFSSESFPSGHVMSGTYLYGFALACALLAPWPRAARFGAAAAIATLLVLNGAANVAVGVHWPSDVAGGVLWALVLLLPALFAAFANRSRALG